VRARASVSESRRRFPGRRTHRALGDLREAGLKRAAECFELKRVFSKTVDVRDGQSVTDFVQAAEREIGPLTVGVANAGVYPNSPVLDMTVEEWDRVIETNMRGVFHTCQAVARRMVAQGTPGKLITISSGAYNSGRKGAAHYCASPEDATVYAEGDLAKLGPHQINTTASRRA
jgi:NAD(P)-dependent dehydrogenase (short-subunit alcohol dehydrogenase family)